MRFEEKFDADHIRERVKWHEMQNDRHMRITRVFLSADEWQRFLKDSGLEPSAEGFVPVFVNGRMIEVRRDT